MFKLKNPDGFQNPVEDDDIDRRLSGSAPIAVDSGTVNGAGAG